LAARKKASQPDEYLTPEAQKGLADRLARIEGHVRSIRQMVIDHLRRRGVDPERRR
jgi:hypothetical protein